MSTVFSIVVLALSQVMSPAPATLDDWVPYPCESGTLRLEVIGHELYQPGLLRIVVPGELACSADMCLMSGPQTPAAALKTR